MLKVKNIIKYIFLSIRTIVPKGAVVCRNWSLPNLASRPFHSPCRDHHGFETRDSMLATRLCRRHVQVSFFTANNYFDDYQSTISFIFAESLCKKYYPANEIPENSTGTNALKQVDINHPRMNRVAVDIGTFRFENSIQGKHGSDLTQFWIQVALHAVVSLTKNMFISFSRLILIFKKIRNSILKNRLICVCTFSPIPGSPAWSKNARQKSHW